MLIWADVTKEIFKKFGRFSCLTPWWFPQLLDFDGPWLVRVSKPVAGLVADGLKKVENLMLRDWLLFGNSGVIVTESFKGQGNCGGQVSLSPMRTWSTSPIHWTMARLLHWWS